MFSSSSVRRRLRAVIAVTAVVLVAGATGATAAKLVTSAQIKDNTILSRDIHDGTIVSKDLHKGAVKKANLDAAIKLGPIASGLVARDGTLSRTNGVTGMTVTTPSTGEYCIAVPGVDAGTHVIVVTADYNTDDTVAGSGSTETVAEMSSASSCGAGVFRVRTFTRDGSNTMTNKNNGFAFAVN